jgi:hypothetical protein
MKHIALISIVAVSIFSGYCYSANAKKTTRLHDMTAPVAATAIVDGVCVGGDMEGLACIR